MADILCLELVDKVLVTASITLHVGHSGWMEKKATHGTATMIVTTSSTKQITVYTQNLYKRIVDLQSSIRRVTITFNNVVDETYQQYDLFTDPTEAEREHRMQKAMLDIKNTYEKSAILEGMNMKEKGTSRERNQQIGGLKSGN